MSDTAGDMTCAFCGLPDSRHRMVDTMRERTIAGELWEAVLADYDMDPVRYCRIADEVDDAYATRIRDLTDQLEATRQRWVNGDEPSCEDAGSSNL